MLLKLSKKLFKLSAIYYKLFDLIINNIFIKLFDIEIGKGSYFHGRPFILNKGKFIIGNDVIINSRFRNNPIGGNVFSSFWIKNDGKIIIGDGCGISNTAFVSEKSIVIGKNVYIGGDCKIYDTDFHSIYHNYRLMRPDPDVKSKEIIIEDNVFIGGGVIILKGVRIGENSVIGAGSVVTKSVPDNQIWAGNPAKFIRFIDENNR